MQNSQMTSIKILTDAEPALCGPKIRNTYNKCWVFEVGDICEYYNTERLKNYDAFVISYEHELQTVVDKVNKIKKEAPYAPVIVVLEMPEQFICSDENLSLVDGFLPYQTLAAPEFIYLLDAHISKQNAFRERDLLAQKARDELESCKELTEQLEQAHNENDEFVYIASHDLKSPLQGVLTVLQWIDEDYKDTIDAGLSKNLNLIRSRIKRTDNLLTDLLQYSRINRALTSYQTFDFKDVENHMFASIADLDNFEVNFPQGALHLPKEAVSTVLFHMVENAVVHHHREKGRIQIRVEENDDDFHITVSDDGAGIEYKYRDKIFEVFKTLQSKDKQEGSGIGLAIARKILSHYDGEVRLSEARLLEGATFEIRWPKQK